MIDNGNNTNSISVRGLSILAVLPFIIKYQCVSVSVCIHNSLFDFYKLPCCFQISHPMQQTKKRLLRNRRMEKCKFVNSVNLSQSCDQPGRFRKESDHPEWPFDQDYLCDRHYKQVKTRVMRKGKP